MAKAGGTDDDQYYKCVAAIDFGTTFSGYAFSFPSEKENIHVKDDWGTHAGIERAFKAPTCVLTTDSGNCGAFLSFGYEAYQMYRRRKPKEAQNHCFYTNYKMHLHKTSVGSDYGQRICK